MTLDMKSLACSARGFIAMLGGLIIHLSIGSYYTFGNFAPYLISYLRNRINVNLRNVDGLWIGATGSIVNCIGMSVGGMLDKKFGPRIATTAGAVLFSSSVALTSVTVKKSFVVVVATYGLQQTLGLAMVYAPPVQTSIKWFPNHASLAAGFILAGFGGEALIFNQVITKFINPENLPPDLTTNDGDKYFTNPDLLDRVSSCLLILAGSYVAMQIIGISMIAQPSQSQMSIAV